MSELYWICESAALIFFWLNLFLNGFALGSLSSRLFKWTWICLVIGWGFLAITWTEVNPFNAFVMATPLDWGFIGIFVMIFIASGLGGGHLCGKVWQYRRHGNDNKSADTKSHKRRKMRRR